ncbi:MAG: hypothetical protein OEZ16_05415 [Chromatiales bacterium]|nr:hypothetical protein [Chromatiales bacterium]
MVFSITFLFHHNVSADFIHYKVDYSGFEVTPEGVGPFKLGAHVSDALAQVGIIIPKVIPRQDESIYDCGSTLIGDYNEFADIRLLTTYNIVRRIDVYIKGIRTVDGSGVGDDLSALEAKFGVERIGAHQIGISHVVVHNKAENSYYLFEGYHQVRSFRVGYEPEVSYVEGCA